jgi:hypothetical protein
MGDGAEGILKWILKKWDEEAWTALIWLRRQVADSCECGNEPLGFTKFGEFLD